MKTLNLTRFENYVTPKPGVYWDVPFQEYLTWNCFSKSSAEAALKSGESLRRHINNFVQTPPMKFGSITDHLLFEPDTFDDDYVALPETYPSSTTRGRAPNKITTVIEKPWSANAIACKEYVASIVDSGATAVTHKDLTKAKLYVNTIKKHFCIWNIDKFLSQVSIVWIEPKSGVLCKCRLDMLELGSEDNYTCITDLKTARDASLDGFSKQMGDLLYEVQAAAYRQAVEIQLGQTLEFRFLVAETDKKAKDTDIPQLAMHETGQESLQSGLLKWQRACRKVATYQQFGFEGYSKKINIINVRDYIINTEVHLEEKRIEGLL